jgi:hypothetical protein
MQNLGRYGFFFFLIDFLNLFGISDLEFGIFFRRPSLLDSPLRCMA